jgi:hypothetical protein
MYSKKTINGYFMLIFEIVEAYNFDTTAVENTILTSDYLG